MFSLYYTEDDSFIRHLKIQIQHDIINVTFYLNPLVKFH